MFRTTTARSFRDDRDRPVGSTKDTSTEAGPLFREHRRRNLSVGRVPPTGRAGIASCPNLANAAAGVDRRLGALTRLGAPGRPDVAGRPSVLDRGDAFLAPRQRSHVCVRAYVVARRRSGDPRLGCCASPLGPLHWRSRASCCYLAGSGRGPSSSAVGGGYDRVQSGCSHSLGQGPEPSPSCAALDRWRVSDIGRDRVPFGSYAAPKGTRCPKGTRSGRRAEEAAGGFWTSGVIVGRLR